MYKTRHIALLLVQAIQRLRKEEEQHSTRNATSHAKLADIFNENTGEIQRVNAPTHQTSTQPTAPAVINTTPRVHQLTTRANTPGMIPQCSRVINPPKSRVITPPVAPEEQTSHPPEWYESPRDKRARTRMRTVPTQK